MTPRYRMTSADAGPMKDRADTVVDAFFDAIEAAAGEHQCNGAEIVAGLAYVLGTLGVTAKFEGAPEIIATAFRSTGLHLPEPLQ